MKALPVESTRPALASTLRVARPVDFDAGDFDAVADAVGVARLEMKRGLNLMQLVEQLVK
jgi:hypothetical protein